MLYMRVSTYAYCVCVYVYCVCTHWDMHVHTCVHVYFKHSKNSSLMAEARGVVISGGKCCDWKGIQRSREGQCYCFYFFCLTGGGDLVNFYFVKTHPAVHFLFGHFEV